MYVQFHIVDSESGLEKYWFTDSLTASHNKTFADSVCCWVIFRLVITLLLPPIALMRDLGIFDHHTFVHRFYREASI
jgi:hypothetical protein